MELEESKFTHGYGLGRGSLFAFWEGVRLYVWFGRWDEGWVLAWLNTLVNFAGLSNYQGDFEKGAGPFCAILLYSLVCSFFFFFFQNSFG
jgi:hypothetical protein